jgi:hypothetical protein
MFQRILPLIAAAGLASLCVPPARADRITPTPRASELPATATNRPFLGAGSALQPVNLATRGYVESEYVLSGLAGVYDWAENGGRQVARARPSRVPYTTRLLLRRPADPKRFSGRVIVELLSAAGGYDTAPLWGLSSEHFLRHGDAWAGLTVKPAAAEALRRFDPLRYAALNFAMTQPPDCRTEPANTEHGLAWDIIAQTGALLRSSSKENPLVEYDVRRLVAGGYAQAGGYVVAYVNVAHDELRLGNGRPVYDAYVDAAGALGSAPVNSCAAPLAAGDPRRQVVRRDAPVVTVMTQSDAGRTLWMRRPDSDAEDDVYRLYEIAGAAHVGPFAPGQPSVADLKIAGLDPSVATPVCAEPPSGFPVGQAMNAIWMQLDDLLVRGLPMVHAPLIEVDADGTLRLDAQGNALGGLRLPQLDMPLAAYRSSNTPRADLPGSRGLCALNGSMRAFTVAQLRALYGSRAGYLKRLGAAVDAAVTARGLEAADAAVIKAQAAKATPAF